MPLYVYKCSECQETQEHLQRSYDEPAPPCDGCGAQALERVPTAPQFRLERGVGWDGWDYMGPGTIGRTVDASKHIKDPIPERLPGSRKITGTD